MKKHVILFLLLLPHQAAIASAQKSASDMSQSIIKLSDCTVCAKPAVTNLKCPECTYCSVECQSKGSARLLSSMFVTVEDKKASEKIVEKAESDKPENNREKVGFGRNDPRVDQGRRREIEKEIEMEDLRRMSIIERMFYLDHKYGYLPYGNSKES